MLSLLEPAASIGPRSSPYGVRSWWRSARRSGLPRHPAQIVVSKRGRLDFDALLFNVPHLRVFLLAGDECVARHESAIGARPWVRAIRLNGDDLGLAFERLRLEERIQRISAIGGRFTATQLVDAGLAQDIYLTTTSLEGGDPNTPWYSGPAAPRLTAITRKQWNECGSGVVFDHFLITTVESFHRSIDRPACEERLDGLDEPDDLVPSSQSDRP
jgi:riboflavin biosynthesis pyrimidine reductase